MNYASITARAEREIDAYLAMAAERRTPDVASSKAVAWGAALGVLALWEGLVAELDAAREPVYHVDHRRLLALIRSVTPQSS
ncbi:hypothetical protein [Burkholderia latens]|uniref:Uncharacterized protein n=1 Tax=Burkholderia latens TaxID=488446 RepID=A0A6H9SVK8_9BURK|nr:hypothetical protein [Burkholderia latens]KAB0644778.1 hypothetical protein F7R21_00165 [Burkholderia latens]VWB17710.1 hypothetical protein BLA24064_00661 [Burkholderia latens]